jgi:hypothetical protein
MMDALRRAMHHPPARVDPEVRMAFLDVLADLRTGPRNLSDVEPFLDRLAAALHLLYNAAARLLESVDAGLRRT